MVVRGDRFPVSDIIFVKVGEGVGVLQRMCCSFSGRSGMGEFS